MGTASVAEAVAHDERRERRDALISLSIPLFAIFAGVSLGVSSGLFLTSTASPFADSMEARRLDHARDDALRQAHRTVQHTIGHTTARFAERTLSTVDVMRFMAANGYASPSAAWPSAWGAGGVLEASPGRAADELTLHFGAYPDLDACQRAAASAISRHRASLAATPTCSADAPHVLEVPLYFSPKTPRLSAAGGTSP